MTDTDIIERLRKRIAVAESESRFGDAEDMREAADEIERLREALATCRELREGDEVEIANLRAAYVSMRKP